MTENEELATAFELYGSAWWNSKKCCAALSIHGQHWAQLRWLQLRYGGWIYHNGPKKAQWVLYGEKAVALMHGIHSLVSLRQRGHIDVVLATHETLSSLGGGTDGV